MKALLIIIIFLSSRVSSNDVYIDAIEQHTKALKGDTIYFIGDCVELNTSRVGNKTLISTDYIKANMRMKVNKLYSIKFFPIELNHDTIVININDYLTSSSKGNLIYEYVGGSSYFFKYDVDHKIYRFIMKTKHSF